MLAIYDTIILKDVIYREKISEPLILDSACKFFFDNICNLISTKKVSDSLTSAGRKTNVHTLDKYLNALKNCFLFYQVNRYDIKGKQYLKTLEKYYCVDVGLKYAILGYKNVNSGHVLENIVYLELKRRGYDVYIGKVGDLEIDFIAINQYDTIYIQVCETIRDSNVLERELKPLRSIRDHNQKILLTLDNDVNNSYDGIKTLNVIDFLLT